MRGRERSVSTAEQNNMMRNCCMGGKRENWSSKEDERTVIERYEKTVTEGVWQQCVKKKKMLDCFKGGKRELGLKRVLPYCYKT